MDAYNLYIHICIIIYMHFVIRASVMDMHICTHCTPIYRYVGITCLILMCYNYSTIYTGACCAHMPLVV